MIQTQKIGTTARLMRYEQVFAILIKYGFEDLLSHPPLNKLVPQSNIFVPKRKGRKLSKFSRYERIRLVCEELGTTFIKFAQIASNRPDLLPEELISELEKLQDSAPPVPIADIRKMLKDSLPRPLEELVEHFDEEPLASASIAQVHKAVLKGGKEVILKIQRPNISRVIATDISILRNILNIISNYFPKLEVYQPQELLKMFEKSISEELDFRLEVMNLLHFEKMFKNSPEAYIPKLYSELCTDYTICMEYIHGYKITDLENLSKYNISGKELATRGIGLYFEQVFKHGFFHADPHPGNIFVMEDGKIAFLDYGMMGSVTDDDQITFAKLLLAIHERNVQEFKKQILKFSTGLNKEKDVELEHDIMQFYRNYSDVTIENIDGREIMKAINSLFFDYKIKIPSSMLLLLKALIIIEGVGLRLDPDYDIIESIGPFAADLISSKLNFKNTKKELVNTIEDISVLAKEFPDDIREILEKIKNGKLHIEFEHKGLHPIFRNTDKIINRISFTFLIVALILSSAIIIQANKPPFIFNVSVLGFSGLVLSGLLSLRLLYAIFKSGKI